MRFSLFLPTVSYGMKASSLTADSSGTWFLYLSIAIDFRDSLRKSNQTYGMKRASLLLRLPSPNLHTELFMWLACFFCLDLVLLLLRVLPCHKSKSQPNISYLLSTPRATSTTFLARKGKYRGATSLGK